MIDDRDDDRNEFKLDFETDLYQNIDEDEENDYHILSDLADFKNQPPTGVYASKSTFHSKRMGKAGRSKLKWSKRNL